MYRTEQINEFYDEKSLEAFWAIVKTGRLTEAAAMLDVTQPAISAAIKKLEVKLDKPLIQRGGYKKIVLTNEGKKLFLFAEKYFSNLSENVFYKTSLLNEKLSVGISSMLPRTKIETILSNIATSNSHNSKFISIDYKIASTSEIVTGFTEHEYGCVFIPNLSRDVCLSIENNIHPLDVSETFAVYTIKGKMQIDELIETNLGLISVENFALINLLPKPLEKVITFKDMNDLYYNIVGKTGYIVLSEKQAAILAEFGFNLEILQDVEPEKVDFGFCFHSGSEALVQICNSNRINIE